MGTTRVGTAVGGSDVGTTVAVGTLVGNSVGTPVGTFVKVGVIGGTVGAVSVADGTRGKRVAVGAIDDEGAEQFAQQSSVKTASNLNILRM